MEYDPIILRYDGLDAEGNRIDLAQIGQSLQGAAQLLGSAGNIVSTGSYAKRQSALSVRVYAGIPKPGSWEIPAIVTATIAPIASELPVIAEIGRAAATRALTAITNLVIDRIAKKPTDMQVQMETVQKAMAEVGQTSRHAIDAVVRMAEQQRPAARLLVVPVGVTCSSMMIGSEGNGAVPIDAITRAAIEQAEPIEIGNARSFEVLLSELDWKTGACKLSLRDEEDPERRIAGQITDPLIQRPVSPYSEAFSAQRWISVVGKPQLVDGAVEKLFISDVAA